MISLKRHRIVELLKEDVRHLLDKEINVKGWVRTRRGNKNVAFIALNDGSIIHHI
ncbi:MAG: asparagine--tRNA ligase, partial [Bacteroidales bacterium]